MQYSSNVLYSPVASDLDNNEATNPSEQLDNFQERHIGPGRDDIARMLSTLGIENLQQLIDQAIPEAIRNPPPDLLFPPMDESHALERLGNMARTNKIQRTFIGMGYYDTVMPAPIERNVLNNPGWITAYTPYQAEIAQGRLEALLTFQQMIIDLTGLPIANASLLDEATAAAEAMTMARRLCKKPTPYFFVHEDVFPQTRALLQTRATWLNIKLVFGAADETKNHDIFGALFQYPDDRGEIRDLRAPIGAVKEQEALAIVACDPLALVLLRSPGEMGADIAVGSTQRFGVPMSFGGPHAAFLVTREEYQRAVPGRIVGVSRDSRNRRALRLSMQTREQHIRREKANSNICTAQTLPACLAAFYAVWHGPEGLKRIALRIHHLLVFFVESLKRSGVVIITQTYFDTVHIDIGSRASSVYSNALTAGYNIRLVSTLGELGISFSETTNHDDVIALLRLICGDHLTSSRLTALQSSLSEADSPLAPFLRRDAILSHQTFNANRNEQAFVRYLKRLQNRDLALDHAMIPLGSCTMKLTATSALLPMGWKKFSGLHPFAPLDQAQGYLTMIAELETWLAALTGFDKVSVQPNSGAQGEYAGLFAIRAYQNSQGESDRDICLIPASAHGTNPASAALCGLKVVVVNCDAGGNIDLVDLEEKARTHKDRLSCLMITYPSTYGIFEESVREICTLIHQYGGQVYFDGANLNALIGLSSPGFIGADAGHINLHKTFAIPHGGGGPGVGPIGVKSHLAPFLPGHIIHRKDGFPTSYGGNGAISAAPWGSTGVLPISWMYICLMGLSGLTQASKMAILNANYVLARLKEHYPLLYPGKTQRVAHECILDIRPLKKTSGVTETDIAKRLMDYGFHAPTVNFPVAGCLMIEPTESEPLSELDRFIEAMICIREEIRRIETGAWPQDDNPLKNAPHTLADLTDQWTHPYSRELAVTPLSWVGENKFWPTVNRIDDVYGDRNFSCRLE